MSALHQYTTVKILSNPSVVVVDNEAATLEVGDEVPVSTGSANVLSANNAVVNTIDYKNTGIILRVQPRVNSNGSVLLDVEQEISSVPNSSSSSSSTASTLTPTISTRKVKSELSVADNQTVLLAGLISDQLSNTGSGVPILDQIPIVGAAFPTRTSRISAPSWCCSSDRRSFATAPTPRPWPRSCAPRCAATAQARSARLRLANDCRSLGAIERPGADPDGVADDPLCARGDRGGDPRRQPGDLDRRARRARGRARLADAGDCAFGRAPLRRSRPARRRGLRYRSGRRGGRHGGGLEAPVIAAAQGALAAATLLAIELIYRRLRGRPGLGVGDVKLAGVAGAWLSASSLPAAIELAALAALLAYSARQIRKRRRFRSGSRCRSRPSSRRRYGSSGCLRRGLTPSEPAVWNAGAAATVKATVHRTEVNDRANRIIGDKAASERAVAERATASGAVHGRAPPGNRWGGGGSLETGQPSRGRVRPPRRSRRLDYDSSVNSGRSRRSCYEFLASPRQSGPRLAGQRWRP